MTRYGPSSKFFYHLTEDGDLFLFETGTWRRLWKISPLDCDVCKLKTKKATPCVSEDSVAKLRFDAQTRLDRDKLQLMVKQGAFSADEYSAAKMRLDA